MRVLDVDVGRKWLGAASCVSSCGQYGEFVWPLRPDASQPDDVLGSRFGVTHTRTIWSVLTSIGPLAMMVYTIVQSRGRPVICDTSKMQGRSQPSVVQTHRESQARVGQTPHCTGGGYMQKADSTGLIDVLTEKASSRRPPGTSVSSYDCRFTQDAFPRDV